MMNPNFEQRVGHNEALFREINDRIEAGRWPGDESERLAFRCECSTLGCNVLVELTPAEYERVRAFPRRFVLAHGHELSDVEVVVMREPRYLVVEKVGEAGRVVESTDPREH
jgi:hypothetical protein